MNKLLTFFLPKITFEVFKFFIATVLLAVVVNLMPIEDGVQTAFTKFFLYLLFPAITYFNRVMYLPPSLDWILLTPTKKLHVVLVHGLINIYKIVLILILICVFYYFHAGEIFGDFSAVWKFFTEEQYPTSFTRFPVDEMVTIMGVIGLLVIFIFGILPSYVQNMQQRQSYQVKRTVQEKLKSYLLAFGGLILSGFFLSEEGVVEALIPWFLRSSVIFAFLIFAAIYSTLTSLRYYFSKKIFFSCGLVSLVLFGWFFYFYASQDILSKKVHVSDKINSLEFLGAYAPQELRDAILEELVASGPSLESLTSHDLKNFIDKTDIPTYERLAASWEKLCVQDHDFTCRLFYGLNSVVGKQPNLVEIMVSSCHNDVGSCYAIVDNKNVSEAARLRASIELEEKCKDTKNEYEFKTCRSYHVLAKKKKR